MFCKNCGKELADGAYVCIGCGCLVTDNVVAKTNTAMREGESLQGDKWTQIFLIISFAFLALTVMFTLWGVINPLFNRYIYYSDSSILRMRVWVVSCVWSVLGSALGTGLVGLCMALKKEQNGAIRLLAIFNFIACIAMVGVATYMSCYIG